MDHFHKQRHEHIAHVAKRQVVTSTSTSTTSTTTPSTSSASSTSSTTTSTTSTSSTPITYATTPPSSQSLVNTTPTGIATYAAQAGGAVPQPGTSNFAPVYTTGAVVKSGSAAGAQSTSASGKVTGASSMSTTTIIGIAAGGLVGFIIIGGIIAYMIRQCRRRNAHAETKFDRNSFIRNSVLLDDKNESSTTLAMDEKPGYGSAASLAPGRSNTRLNPPGAGMAGPPRPPTMIQRHYNAPALQPGQHMQYPAAPPASYYPAGGMPVRAPYANGPAKDLPSSPADSFFTQAKAQQQGAMYYPGQYRQNNGQATPELGRAPTYKSQASEPADLALEPSNGGKARSGRGLSVTPFQAQQYAEISRLVNQPLPPMPPSKANGESYELPARNVTSPPPAMRSPPPMGRPMDMSPSGFRSPSPPSPLQPPRNIVSPFQRIGSTPPMLPPLITSSHPSDASLSQFNSDRSLNNHGRSGTPTDPNPQQYFTATRSTSPQQVENLRSNPGFPTLVEPNNAPRTPRFHSGFSATSHVGQEGNFGSAGNLNTVAQSRSGSNLAVPGQDPSRRLSVRNSMASDGRYSMYGEEDVYGGI
ncbi:hypothetical protein CALVIDRAFT_532287 [Calocera viscosa TUFC12733]|uniref:Uncharacterized protein n=1 Tax=Calocera viscosa (strain TUFC12733) TaxID=1330018 RepID=A0A167S2J6_CALVF|nr:hypothetical protein CALVIDRAFT_532287 [Calocera viscosa TUFC12733]